MNTVIGKGFSIIAAIGLINSFYMAWYRFPGITNVTPVDVLNNALSQPFTQDNLIKIGSVAGILILAALMFLTVIFPNLLLSITKLAIAAGLALVHIGYFYSNVIASQTPFEWIKIVETSPGFLLFCGALILYFISVLSSIITSPLRGISKIVGL